MTKVDDLLSVPKLPFTVKFKFALQKDDHIPGEFPYESLERTATLVFDEDTLAHPLFFMQPMEQLIIRGIEGNGGKALNGLAYADSYDRIVIKEWSIIE